MRYFQALLLAVFFASSAKPALACIDAEAFKASQMRINSGKDALHFLRGDQNQFAIVLLFENASHAVSALFSDGCQIGGVVSVPVHEVISEGFWTKEQINEFNRSSFSIRKSQLDHYWDFIEKNTRYKRPAAAVKFQLLSKRDINAYFYGSQSAGKPQILAVYFKDVIYIYSGFDPDRDQEVIVHELLHHAQAYSPIKTACRAEAEREAYLLQTKYIDHHLGGNGRRAVPAYLETLVCK